MTPDFLLHIMTVIAGAGGVYAAIRADLVFAKTKAEQAAGDASEAHKRLDEHINFHVGDRRHG